MRKRRVATCLSMFIFFTSPAVHSRSSSGAATDIDGDSITMKMQMMRDKVVAWIFPSLGADPIPTVHVVVVSGAGMGER